VRIFRGRGHPHELRNFFDELGWGQQHVEMIAHDYEFVQLIFLLISVMKKDCRAIPSVWNTGLRW
jgi:hypothetical protein